MSDVMYTLDLSALTPDEHQAFQAHMRLATAECRLIQHAAEDRAEYARYANIDGELRYEEVSRLDAKADSYRGLADEMRDCGLDA